MVLMHCVRGETEPRVDGLERLLLRDRGGGKPGPTSKRDKQNGREERDARLAETDGGLGWHTEAGSNV